MKDGIVTSKNGDDVMTKLDLFTMALGIEEPWYIKEIKFDQNVSKQLDIYVEFKKGSKFYYKDEELAIDGYFKAHDTVEKTWQHLSFFEYRCFIHAKMPKIYPKKGTTKIIKGPWEGVMKGFTLMFEALLLQLAQNMPVSKVSRLVGTYDVKIWGMIRKYAKAGIDLNDYAELEMFGVDETSKAKGHDYVTIFVDMKNKKTIYVTVGKDNKVITDFREELENKNGKKENIKTVSSDMSKAFIKGVNREFINAEIVFDKFHIMKAINDAVNQVRIRESKTESILKGSKYSILKNKKNLTKKQEKKLEEIKLSKIKLQTLKAIQIREAFQELYKIEELIEFEQKLKEWYFWATHCRIEEMKKIAKTIKEHWAGVVGYKKEKVTNALLEGFNSIIQMAKRRARGFKDLENFKAIIYLLTGKLQLEKINALYQPL